MPDAEPLLVVRVRPSRLTQEAVAAFKGVVAHHADPRGVRLRVAAHAATVDLNARVADTPAFRADARAALDPALCVQRIDPQEDPW